jgi:hypothetical protein
MLPVSTSGCCTELQMDHALLVVHNLLLQQLSCFNYFPQDRSTSNMIHTLLFFTRFLRVCNFVVAAPDPVIFLNN